MKRKAAGSYERSPKAILRSRHSLKIPSTPSGERRRSSTPVITPIVSTQIRMLMTSRERKMAESLKRMGYIKGESITESSNKENSTEMELVFTPADSSKVCSTPLSPAKRTLFNPFKIAADITNTSLSDCDGNPSQRQGHAFDSSEANIQTIASPISCVKSHIFDSVKKEQSVCNSTRKVFNFELSNPNEFVSLPQISSDDAANIALENDPSRANGELAESSEESEPTCSNNDINNFLGQKSEESSDLEQTVESDCSDMIIERRTWQPVNVENYCASEQNLSATQNLLPKTKEQSDILSSTQRGDWTGSFLFSDSSF